MAPITKNHDHTPHMPKPAMLPPPTSHPPQPATLLSLPTEILQQIFFALPTVQSLHSLSLTSRRFHLAYSGSQKLLIASQVLETQYGPLHDATQLITLNAHQPVHSPRTPSFSLALAKQLVDKGAIVQKWVSLYPLLLWRSDPTSRRRLTTAEAYRLRRALYRFWMYNEACADEFRRDEFPLRTGLRHLFLKQFSTTELRELEEVVGVFEDMLRWDCCPSDSTMQAHYSSLSPTRDLLDFGGCRKLVRGSGRSIREVLVDESWGDNIAVAEHVSHLLQMTPEHLLFLREECRGRRERERYLDEIEAWTYNGFGIYEGSSELRWDLAQVLGGRGDGERRGGGARWITWEEGEGKDEMVEEWVEDVVSEKLGCLLGEESVVVVGW